PHELVGVDAPVGQELGHGLPLHELHGEEAFGTVAEELVKAYEVRMDHASGGTKLSLQLTDGFRTPLAQHLQSDAGASCAIVDRVHMAHAPLAELVLHDEAAE